MQRAGSPRPPTRGNAWPYVVALTFGLCLFVAGFGSGVAADRARLLPAAVSIARAAQSIPNLDVFEQAWDIVQQHYVERDSLDPTRMLYGAIDGMLASLGDEGHTRFLSPDDLKSEEDTLAGKLEGIGAELARRDGRPTIVAPIPDSPAQRAGIRPGDVIVKVDGQDVGDRTLEQVVNLVRGPAGTPVTLTVLHKDETEVTDITVVRAQLTLPSVTWAMVPGTQDAHIQVAQFGEQAESQLIAALDGAKGQGAAGLVLDLRNDPGGLRDQAIAVASQFLTNGNVLLEQDAQGHRTPYPVKSGGKATDIPLVVLVNEGTASSAEIVAGAIQDHQRAQLVGQKTFGTGTVLSQYRLQDGSALLLGTAEWLTPDGRQIWHHGITPDVVVALPQNVNPLMPREEATLSAADLQASQDTQLLTALSLLPGQ